MPRLCRFLCFEWKWRHPIRSYTGTGKGRLLRCHLHSYRSRDIMILKWVERYSFKMVVALWGSMLGCVTPSCMGCRVQAWKHFLKTCISWYVVWCICGTHKGSSSIYLVQILAVTVDLCGALALKTLHNMYMFVLRYWTRNSCIIQLHTEQTLYNSCFLQSASAVMTFAFVSVNKNVIASSTTGSFTVQEVKYMKTKHSHCRISYREGLGTISVLWD